MGCALTSAQPICQSVSGQSQILHGACLQHLPVYANIDFVDPTSKGKPSKFAAAAHHCPELSSPCSPCKTLPPLERNLRNSTHHLVPTSLLSLGWMNAWMKLGSRHQAGRMVVGETLLPQGIQPLVLYQHYLTP